MLQLVPCEVGILLVCCDSCFEDVTEQIVSGLVPTAGGCCNEKCDAQNHSLLHNVNCRINPRKTWQKSWTFISELKCVCFNSWSGRRTLNSFLKKACFKIVKDCTSADFILIFCHLRVYKQNCFFLLVLKCKDFLLPENPGAEKFNSPRMDHTTNGRLKIGHLKK